MNAHIARDSDGDLVVDLLNDDRSRLVEFDFGDPAESIRSFAITALSMRPGVNISEILSATGSGRAPAIDELRTLVCRTVSHWCFPAKRSTIRTKNDALSMRSFASIPSGIGGCEVRLG
ncbi:hypothetical protein ABIF97_004150 [Bradyrhizobium japonicum]